MVALDPVFCAVSDTVPFSLCSELGAIDLVDCPYLFVR